MQDNSEPRIGKKELKFEERELLEKYCREKITIAKISILVNRPHSTITNEYQRNGGRLKYSAVKAHERAKELRRKKVGSLKKHARPGMSSRIEALEMQIEILTDLIKEIKNDTANKKL